MRRAWANLVIVAAAAAVWGCVPEARTSFDSPSPNKRLDAIVQAAEGGGELDPETLRGLVGQLESSDPAARMLAIRALERRTGQTLGFEPSDPEWKRQAAVRRWKTYADQEPGDGAPGGS